jgi:hypothetical protein
VTFLLASSELEASYKSSDISFSTSFRSFSGSGRTYPRQEERAVDLLLRKPGNKDSGLVGLIANGGYPKKA